ncbi:hypothetical protein CR513_08708, partial [Mucuna pruriens]
MWDLGTSINVMPSSVYKSLDFGDLEPISVIIQLENRSIVHPLGILEDVLAQINELIFLPYFYMLDMEHKLSSKGSTLILGRPFLMTTRTKIDVHARNLFIEFGDNMVQFNIFEAMKYPTKNHFVFGLNLYIGLFAFSEFYNFFDVVNVSNFVHWSDFECTNKSVRSYSKSTSLTIYYASTSLRFEQEERLLQVLRKHRKTIGWTLAHLLRINPSICMHRILLEDEA